jgi:hypothetical protein
VVLVRERSYLSGRRLSTKLVPTFVDRGVSLSQRGGSLDHIVRFLDRSRYFSFQVASELYPRGYFLESLLAPGMEPGPLDL